MDVVIAFLGAVAVAAGGFWIVWRRLVIPRLRWNATPSQPKQRPDCEHRDRSAASLYVLSLQLDLHGTPTYRMGPGGPDF